MAAEIIVNKQHNRSLWVTSLLLGLFSLATTSYCLTLIKINGQLSPLWFSTTLMTIVVFRNSLRRLPLLLGSCLLGVIGANTLMLGVGTFDLQLPLLNLLQATAGGLLLRVLLDPQAPLNTLSSWIKMVLAVGLFTPFVTAILACAFLDLPQQSLAQLFSTWVASEMIGMLALGPVALLWQRGPQLQYRVLLETLITQLVTLVLCWLVLRYLPWPFVFVIVILFYSAVRLPRLAAFIVYFATVSMIPLMLVLNLIPAAHASLSPLFSVPWLPLLLALVPSHLMTLVMHSFREERQHISESEARFRHAMEYSAIGMALISPEGRWLQVNRSLCNLLGYSSDELKEMTAPQLSHPDDLAAHLTKRARLLTGEITSYSMEKRYLRKDKQTVWTMLTMSLVRNHHQQPLYFIAQIENITDLKQSEKINQQLMERITQANERMRITLNAIDEAVISTDDKMQVIFMNPVAEKMTGWAQSHAAGKPIADILRITQDGDEVSQEIVLTCAYPKHTIPEAADRDLLLHNRAGEQFAINYSLSPLSTSTGENIGSVMVIQDISESREIFKRLRYSAAHDMLTRLPNRASFEQRLKQLLLPQNAPPVGHVLAFVDLDRFKAVNDNAGHAAGDNLLRKLASIMSRQLRSTDFLARIGGDEFALLLPECSLEEALEVTHRLVKAIGQYRFLWQGQDYFVGASAGITVFSKGSSAVEIMAQADVACYQAKNSGRGQVAVYHTTEGDILRS